MLKVSQLERINVYRPKRKAEGDPAQMKAKDLSLVGKAHLTVFDPKGRHVVGFMVKKPDVASMIKVPDAFLALDAFDVCDLGLVATKGDDSFDDKARERLGLQWEKCIIWCGMDAKTTDGKVLGWVSDVEFDAKTGKVSTFFVGDGNVSTALVGSVEIPADMLRGYRDGFMLVDPKAAGLALDGGAAAKAGEAYARAKYEGGKAAKRIASSAGSAVQKGAYGLGKMIGDTKRAFKESSADDQPAPREVKSISEPVEPVAKLEGEVGEPREFVPVSEGTPEAEAPGRGTTDEGQPVSEGAAAPTKEAATSGATKKGTAGSSKATSKSATKTSTSAKKKSTKKRGSGDDAARAIGRQLGRTKGMFGAFVSEYKKASK